MKMYLAYDIINHEYEDFETIKDARKWLEECFLDREEGYHPDAEGCKIFKLCETVSTEVVDTKSNYKYENEEDIPEDDEVSEAWPHGNHFDEIWEHKFTSTKPVEITEEEIIEAAKQYAKLPSVFDPNALRAGFYNGAKWRDRHG